MGDVSQRQEFGPMRWERDALFLIDQRALPAREQWLRCESASEVARAIRDMTVRGAPAIGCAAAYGIALAARRACEREPAIARAPLARAIEAAAAELATSRPTAVNLFWALAEMRRELDDAPPDTGALEIASRLAARAEAIHADDVAMCRRIGEHGAALIPDPAVVITHCNTGALATGGHGTALGVLRTARAAGKRVRVIADETRPYLQGARLTAWELVRDGFDVTLIPDAAAAFVIARGGISCAIVGADRIAANGDVANKIGTYALALACRAHGVPFYVAAPRSTIDLDTATGADIPIEERSPAEMLAIGGTPIAPPGVQASYPAFDITPANLVTAIITDRGICRPPYPAALRSGLRSQCSSH